MLRFLVVFFLSLASTTAALAATCSPATSSGTAATNWQSYCWLDFSSYSDSQVLGSGQSFSYALSDGSTLSFTLKASSDSANGLTPVTSPAAGTAALGNTGYIGIPNKPVLYESDILSIVTLTMSNITLTPSSGANSTSSFQLVFADAEASQQREILTFTTNGANWTLLDQIAASGGVSFPAFTMSGNIATVTGSGTSGGSYLFGTANPSNVVMKLSGSGSGKQGIMIAVLPVTSVAANDDTVSGVLGALNVLNVFNNDTVDGAAATPANATLSIATGSSLPAPISFNLSTGAIDVAAGTAAGTYSFTYKICARAAAAICTTAQVSVTVAPIPLPANIIITKTADETTADRHSLKHVIVHLYDAHGAPLSADSYVTIELSGAARLKLANASIGAGASDLDRVTPGIQLRVNDGVIAFDVIAPTSAQDIQLRATAGFSQAMAKLKFTPELRPLYAIGIVEGVVSKARLGGATGVGNDGFEHDLKNWSKHFSNGSSIAGRAAFFVKGRVGKGTSLTLAFDSEKATGSRLMRDISPELYYPVTGDASVTGFDARSSQRGYLRIDHGARYAL